VSGSFIQLLCCKTREKYKHIWKNISEIAIDIEKYESILNLLSLVGNARRGGKETASYEP
jgi:hypothetical protein